MDKVNTKVNEKVDDELERILNVPKEKIIVNVRWWDGYLEVFECSEVRQGGHILWMRLMNGQNRTIPLLANVRWFSTDRSYANVSNQTNRTERRKTNENRDRE